MQITDIQITTASGPDNFIGYVSFVIENVYVIRDVRLVKNKKGGYIVAMPSVKTSTKCTGCGRKIPGNSNYCQHCGEKITEQIYGHAEIAHPISREARAVTDRAILDEARRLGLI